MKEVGGKIKNVNDFFLKNDILFLFIIYSLILLLLSSQLPSISQPLLILINDISKDYCYFYYYYFNYHSFSF